MQSIKSSTTKKPYSHCKDASNRSKWYKEELSCDQQQHHNKQNMQDYLSRGKATDHDDEVVIWVRGGKFLGGDDANTLRKLRGRHLPPKTPPGLHYKSKLYYLNHGCGGSGKHSSLRLQHLLYQKPNFT